MRLLLAAVVFSLSVFATTITSSSGTVFLDAGLTQAAKVVDPHPVWTNIPGAQWMSVSGCTGSRWSDPGCEVPNMTWHQFYTHVLGGGQAVLTVAADDTLNLGLDGHRLYTAAQGGIDLNGLAACASIGVGCVTPTVLRFNIPAGDHVLMFDVFQGGNAAFGLTFKLDVTATSTPTSVPEPASFGIAAAGLGLLAIFRLRGSRPNRTN